MVNDEEVTTRRHSLSRSPEDGPSRECGEETCGDEIELAFRKGSAQIMLLECDEPAYTGLFGIRRGIAKRSG